jgi:hypothetical protein
LPSVSLADLMDFVFAFQWRIWPRMWRYFRIFSTIQHLFSSSVTFMLASCSSGRIYQRTRQVVFTLHFWQNLPSFLLLKRVGKNFGAAHRASLQILQLKPKDIHVMKGRGCGSTAPPNLNLGTSPLYRARTPQVQNYAAKHRPSTRKISVSHHE